MIYFCYKDGVFMDNIYICKQLTDMSKIELLEKKVITDYIELQKKVEKLIETFNTDKGKLAVHINMSRSTLNRKLKGQSFSPDEMYKIAEYYNKLQREVLNN